MASSVKCYFVFIKYKCDGEYGVESNRDILELKLKGMESFSRGKEVSLVSKKSPSTSFTAQCIACHVSKPHLLAILKQREDYERIKGVTLDILADPEALPRQVVAKKRIADSDGSGDELDGDAVQTMASKKARSDQKAKERQILKNISQSRNQETFQILNKVREEEKKRDAARNKHTDEMDSPHEKKQKLSNKTEHKNGKGREEKNRDQVNGTKENTIPVKDSTSHMKASAPPPDTEKNKINATNEEKNACEACKSGVDMLAKRERDYRHYKEKYDAACKQIDGLRKDIQKRDVQITDHETERDIMTAQLDALRAQLIIVQQQLIQSADLPELVKNLKLAVFELGGVKIPAAPKLENVVPKEQDGPKDDTQEKHQTPVSPKEKEETLVKPVELKPKEVEEKTKQKKIVSRDIRVILEDEQENSIDNAGFGGEGNDPPDDPEDEVLEDFEVETTLTAGGVPIKPNTEPSSSNKLTASSDEKTIKRPADVKPVTLAEQLVFTKEDPGVSKLSDKYEIYGDADAIETAKGGSSPYVVIRKLLAHLVKPEYYHFTPRGQANKGSSGAFHGHIMSFFYGVVRDVKKAAHRKDPRWIDVTDPKLNAAFGQALVEIRKTLPDYVPPVKGKKETR